MLKSTTMFPPSAKKKGISHPIFRSHVFHQMTTTLQRGSYRELLATPISLPPSSTTRGPHLIRNSFIWLFVSNPLGKIAAVMFQVEPFFFLRNLFPTCMLNLYMRYIWKMKALVEDLSVQFWTAAWAHLLVCLLFEICCSFNSLTYYQSPVRRPVMSKYEAMLK